MKTRRVIARTLAVIGFLSAFFFICQVELDALPFCPAFIGELISLGVCVIGIMWNEVLRK